MKKKNPLRMIVDVFALTLILLGVVSLIALPIFLIISAIILNNTLPMWFVIPSYILSALSIIFLLGLLFRDKEDDKSSHKNHMLD